MPTRRLEGLGVNHVTPAQSGEERKESGDIQSFMLHNGAIINLWALRFA